MRDVSSKLSIMQLVHSLRIGGSEKVALDISSYLDRAQFDPSVCAMDLDGELAHELDSRNIRHHVFYRRGLEPGVSVRLYRYLRQHHVDVVHTHHFAQLFYAALPARLAGARIIHTEHEFFTYKTSALGRALLRPLSLFCERVTVVGPEVADYFLNTIGIPKRRLKIVLNGVDVETFNYDRKAAREELGLRSQEIVIGTIGRLEPEKSQTTLLDVFQHVAAQHPHARLMIAGDGQLADELKSYAGRLGVMDRTLFLGYRRDVPRLLAAMDIFVLTSIREGLPISLIEAMAARRPVVASNVGSVTDLVRDGCSGLVVTAGDTNAFIGAVESLVSSPELRQRMGNAGRETVEASYSLSAIVREYEELYRTAVSKRHVWH